MTAPTILVVEDEALVREVVCLDLADMGFTVVEAGAAPPALALLGSERAIDCLFTDIRLPGAPDGLGLAEEARRLRPDLPVLYATGYTPDAMRMVAGGRLLRKPYRAPQLIEALAALGVHPPAA